VHSKVLLIDNVDGELTGCVCYQGSLLAHIGGKLGVCIINLVLDLCTSWVETRCDQVGIGVGGLPPILILHVHVCVYMWVCDQNAYLATQFDSRNFSC